MIITHAAIYTHDLERLKDFYVRYFGAVSNDRYGEPDGFSSYFLSFDGGARLELMSHTVLERVTPCDRRSGFSHLAFSAGSRAAVDELTNRLVADGYELYSPCRETGDGYYESCIADPDGNRIEITI